MNNKTRLDRRVSFTLSFAALTLVFALLFVPSFFTSNAGSASRIASKVRPGNYDIRRDKRAAGKLANFRARAGKSAASVADARDEFVRGESALRSRVQSLRVEYNDTLGIPEVIGPAPGQRYASLTGQVNSTRAETLRSFTKENSDLIGVPGSQSDQLKVTADYTNPDRNLSFASLEQHINGIPVFQGEIKAGFSKRGEMIRVINDLAPGLDGASLSQDFGDPAAAVDSAVNDLNADRSTLDLRSNGASTDELKQTFGSGDWPTTAEKMYFPTEPGVAVPAWRVLIWERSDAYYVVVDGATRDVLWRKNITEDQTQPATYKVYASDQNNDNLGHALDSPAPGNPIAGTIDPSLNLQAALGGRTSVTLIGNEGPLSFNNLGWLTDGGNDTAGNNVEAGLDRDISDGVDATNGRAQGTNRTFNYAYTPSNVSLGTEGGDNPLPVGEPVPSNSPTACSSIAQPHGITEAQKGAVVNLFYLDNRYHDALYQVGFNEQARNFQNDNFSRGGAQNDRVSAEADDCSGVNNANFATPSDGTAGRMQMYLFSNGSAPFRDGSLDSNVVWHEHTHGVSNRLIGNGSGLSTTQARGLGEGWSDLYAFLLGSKTTDPANGVYTTGAYATYKCCGLTTFTSNYYYGIRRFPYAAKSVTGGPNNRPYNPLTFADIDPAQINCGDGAFNPSPLFGCSPAADVHNEGEIWAVTGIEVWSRFVTRLGHDAGTLRTLQLYTDGMKLTPLNPTFLQARDALISAAQAGGVAADVADIWSAFAARGMGFSATNPSGNTVVQSFDTPNLTQTAAITVNDSTGNNNGVADPGETVILNIPFFNNTGQTATSVSFQLVGGGSANLASLANNTTGSAQLLYSVPAATQCGTAIPITINVNSNLGPASFARSIFIGAPVSALSQNFDSVTPPDLPAGWTTTSVLGGTNWVSVSTSSDSAPNSVYAIDTPSFASETDLTSPSIAIASPAATVSFRHRYDTEAAWDGGVLEISISGGAFVDIITAGGSFTSNGYNATMTAAAPDPGPPPYTPNPLNGRQGWTGNSGGFVTTIAKLPASAAGQNVRLRWRMGADDNTAGTGPNSGWYIDTINVVGSYSCSVVNNIAHRAPFDFDGDGKTDIGIFRPSVGQWWYSRSSDAVVRAGQFGSATDIITPGDFTGDGKADIAFYRPSTGFWFILRSEDGSFFSFPFGTAGDIPMPADFDGDGKTDAAVFRPSTGTWFILQSSGAGTGILHFGANGDKPVSFDYDGDGKADIGIVRDNLQTGNKEWWILRSTQGILILNFGIPGDLTVPGDYTGDGKADVAFFRPSTGFWYILRSEDHSFFSFPFGTNGDIPTPGDYDGDGKTDAAVFRPSTSTWFVNRSGGSGTLIAGFGLPTDQPVPSSLVR